MPEYLYVLSNPTMQGIVKIGRTNDVHQRMANLSAATGVPVPFVLELAIEIDDAAKLERALHRLLDGSRVNPRREFFQVDPEDLWVVLADCGTNVTDSFGGPQAPPPLSPVPVGPTPGDLGGSAADFVPITQTDIEAGKRWERKTPTLNFKELGILTETNPEPMLEFIHPRDDGTYETAKVVGERLVEFRSEQMYLTRATKIALGREHLPNDIAPRPYWRFEGKTLQEITDELYG